MFERFSRAARDAVVAAQRVARGGQAVEIHGAHLLAGVFAVDDAVSRVVLTAVGLSRDAVTAAVRHRDTTGRHLGDDALLAELGIDLDQVRARVEESFGPGAMDRTADRTADHATDRTARRGRRHPPRHLPFSVDAKAVMEAALREAVRLGQRTLEPVHIVLGVLSDGTAVVGLLDDVPARLGAARVIVDEELGGRRAG